MIPIDVIFDTYINVNFLLFLVFALWCVGRLLLKPLGLVHAYTTQLRLLYGVFFAVLVSPIFVLLYSLLLKFGAVSPDNSFNLSDLVVAQYLQGSFEMKPAALEEFLGLRSRLTADFLGMNSLFAKAGMVVILFGLGLFTVRIGISIFSLRKILRDSHILRKSGNLQLLVSDTVPVPFSTRTLNKRYVIIPSNMLTNAKDLKIAIGHEFQHMRQFDLEWEIVLELLRSVFFWNPAYYFLKRQVEQLRELSCDQRVLVRKKYNIKDYCDCLLRVCENSLAKRNLNLTALPKVALTEMNQPLFGRSSAFLLRQRVNSLLDKNTDRHPKSMFLGLMTPLIAIVILSTLAIQKPNDWSQDRIMLSTIINLERLANHNNLALNR